MERYGPPHIGWPALTVFAIYFCIDFAARLGQFDYACAIWHSDAGRANVMDAGTACLARLRPRFARAPATLDLPPDMILGCLMSDPRTPIAWPGNFAISSAARPQPGGLVCMGLGGFAAARSADKPIFLSVGYSTCYWCHVMERQCFENEEIARQMNDLFVSIKVDREERPDVDQLYMLAVQLMSGRAAGR